MKIKTSELQDGALDWAVNQIEECCDDPHTPLFSTDWALGGPIIEREELSRLSCYGTNEWGCLNGEVFCEGPTPLIAAMRCYVASKLGDEIELPEEMK